MMVGEVLEFSNFIEISYVLKHWCEVALILLLIHEYLVRGIVDPYS